MSPLKKTYFLTSSHDCPPSILGGLITDPRSPEISLANPNSQIIARLRQDAHITQECDAVREFDSSMSMSPSIWATFALAGNLGPRWSLGTTQSKGTGASYAIPKLSTTRINPDMQAIKALFEEEEVQAAIKHSRFRTNVYLIDSIQVAHGAEYWVGKTREAGGNVDVSMDLTCTGAPVTVGVGVNGKKTSTASSCGRIMTDFVFAYSLREIMYRRKTAVRQRRMFGGDLMSHGGRQRSTGHVLSQEGDWVNQGGGVSVSHEGVKTPRNAMEDHLDEEDSVAEVLLLKEDDPGLPGYWDWEGQDATDLDGSVCQVVAVGAADSDED